MKSNVIDSEDDFYKYYSFPVVSHAYTIVMTKPAFKSKFRDPLPTDMNQNAIGKLRDIYKSGLIPTM